MSENDFEKFAERADSPRLKEAASSIDLQPQFPKTTQKITPLKKNKYRPKTTGTARKKRKANVLKAVLVTLASLLVLLLAAATVVCEPWTAPAVDDYAGPKIIELPYKVLAVGAEYVYDVELGENEMIRDVFVSDDTLLAVDENGVKALGEYFRASVAFSVTEKEVPKKQYAHTIEVFGKDLSAEYDTVRSWLRNLVGVESFQLPRTEIRVIAQYTQPFMLNGLDLVTTEQPIIELGSGDTTDIEPVLAVGEAAQAVSADESIVSAYSSASEEKPNLFTISGEGEGESFVLIKIGTWKKVDSETYAAYIASQPAQAVQPEQTEGEDGEEETPINTHENEIFVVTRALKYPITVA